MIEREEHLAWCQRRALKYIDANDLPNAYASMCSDMGKHPETGITATVGQLGIMHVMNKNADGLRHWIEGFR